jgi:hypothetical protein
LIRKPATFSAEADQKFTSVRVRTSLVQSGRRRARPSLHAGARDI